MKYLLVSIINQGIRWVKHTFVDSRPACLSAGILELVESQEPGVIWQPKFQIPGLLPFCAMQIVNISLLIPCTREILPGILFESCGEGQVLGGCSSPKNSLKECVITFIREWLKNTSGHYCNYVVIVANHRVENVVKSLP